MKQNNLIFNLDMDNRPFKEDILKTGTNGSLFEEQYHHVFIQLNQYLAALEDWDEKKDPDLDNLNNIFAFIGDRGSGKTSCMVSVAHALKEKEIAKKKQVAKIFEDYEYINKSKFHTIDLIDPTYFDSNNNLLSLFLAKIYTQFRQMESNRREAQPKRNEKLRNEFLNKLALAQKQLNLMLDDGSKYYGLNSLEHLAELSGAVDLKKSIEEVEDSFMAYFDMKDTLLLLRIDDIDLSTEKAAVMAEIIRKYFIQPNMIVLMAVKMDQMKKVKKNELIHQYADLLWAEQGKNYDVDGNQMAEMEESFNEMVEQYLIKLIPQSQRIYMPESESYRDRPLRIESKHLAKPLEYCSVKNGVLELIFIKTRYLFYNTALTTSFMVPRNLRELLQLLKLLCLMDDYWADEDHPALYNKKAFKKYLFEGWTRNNLSVSMQTEINALLAIDDIVFLNGRVLQCLKKRFEKYIDDTLNYLFGQLNVASVYNFSVGDVLGAVDYIERRNIDMVEQKFLFLIKTLYSIRLYETYDEVTEQPATIIQQDDILRNPRFKGLNEYEKLTGGYLMNTSLIELLPGAISGNVCSREYEIYKLAQLMDKCNNDWDEAIKDNLVQTVEIIMLCTARMTSDLPLTKFRSSRSMPHIEAITQGKALFNLGCLFFNLPRIEKCYHRFESVILYQGDPFTQMKIKKVGQEFINNLMSEHQFKNTLYGRFLTRTIEEKQLSLKTLDRHNMLLKNSWLSFCSIRNTEILDAFISETAQGYYQLDERDTEILKGYFENAGNFAISSYDRPDEKKAPYRITFKFMKDMAEVLNHETASKAFADIYDDRVVDKDRFDDLR